MSGKVNGQNATCMSFDSLQIVITFRMTKSQQTKVAQGLASWILGTGNHWTGASNPT